MKWPEVRAAMLAQLLKFIRCTGTFSADPVHDPIWALYRCGCDRIRAGIMGILGGSCSECCRPVECLEDGLPWATVRARATDPSKVVGIGVPRDLPLTPRQALVCTNRLIRELDVVACST